MHVAVFGFLPAIVPNGQFACRRPLWHTKSNVHCSKERMMEGEMTLNQEPFVSADEAAKFLGIKRRFLLSLARRGIAGAYALGTGGIRKIWVFRLSELADAIDSKRYHLIHGSPR